MARIRSVKPELFDSGSLAKTSRDARYLFVGLFTLVDDEGRLRDLPKKIAGDLFPYDDDVSADQVDLWLDALASVGSVVRYIVNGEPYLYIPQWLAHQKIDHPTKSRLPGPEDADNEAKDQVTAPRENFASNSRGSR